MFLKLGLTDVLTSQRALTLYHCCAACFFFFFSVFIITKHIVHCEQLELKDLNRTLTVQRLQQ